jgi:hypothetical protein
MSDDGTGIDARIKVLQEERKAYQDLADDNQAKASGILKKIRKLEKEKERQAKRLNSILG